MKKRILAGLLLACLLVNVPVYAGNFEAFDHDSAMAGASAALSNFYKMHNELADAGKALSSLTASIEAEEETTTLPEIQESLDDRIEEYEEPKVGAVSAESLLNVREAPTTSSALAGEVVRGSDINVIGEAVLNGKLWYHVEVEDNKGYVAGSYILFDEEAEELREQVRIELNTPPPLPKKIPLADLDFSDVDEEVAKKIEDAIKQTNFCIEHEFAAQEEVGSVMGMYSILIYMIENYQHVIDLSYEYGLDDIHKRASDDLQQVELRREQLTRTSGQSDEDIINQIVQVKKEAEAEAKRSLGVQMAEYAATFVGVLPYIWGGASLSRGADCSGFVSQIYAHYGLLDQGTANAHGYDSRALRGVGRAVNVSEIQPGDLVCYNGHVAMYYGNGVVVHEPSPGKKASFGNLYMMHIITVRRLY